MMEVECMFCHRIIGMKEGHGVTGKTSSICGACLDVYYPEYSHGFKKQDVLAAPGMGPIT
ncbi:hypothetical protein [Geobacter sp.]|uniref:hypothetical protein n=1 Tax=Geobacter sp. TaxID=46610 RepID=UPI0026376D85|nr:hypothetical protein [Geobacter sp.]